MLIETLFLRLFEPDQSEIKEIVQEIVNIHNTAILKNETHGHNKMARVGFVGSVVEWLTHRTNDQHGLGSKPTCAILLCSWEKHFTALSPAWWS